MSDLLTIDCGNSTITCIAHGEGRRIVLPCRPECAAQAVRFAEDSGISRCVGVAVVPQLQEVLKEEFRLAGYRLELAGHDLPCPLSLDYATPATLGADRWLGALAAHEAFGRAVTIDCGSATTCNLVELDGTFRGGAIAPGLDAFLVGMSTQTPGLPKADPLAGLPLPAATSQGSVDAGIGYGYAGMVERLIAELLRAAQGPAAVVATGGRVDVLLRFSRLRDLAVRRDLVHEGLAILAASSCI